VLLPSDMNAMLDACERGYEVQRILDVDDIRILVDALVDWSLAHPDRIGVAGEIAGRLAVTWSRATHQSRGG